MTTAYKKNNLKILFLSNRGLLPIKDGHTRRSFNILKGLAKDQSVHYLSLYEESEEIVQSNIKQLESICEKVEFYPASSKSVSIQMISRLIRSLFSLDPYSLWRHYSGPFSRRVSELILVNKYDIIHCDILPLAYTVRKMNGVIRTITNHDVSYLKCLSIGKQSRNILVKLFLYFEALKLKKLERTVFKQVDFGIVVSEHDKVILQKLCPEGKFVAIENGVDVKVFQSNNTETEPEKLIWVGGFDHYPNEQGIHYFLENIYPQIKRTIPAVKLDIVGGGVKEKLWKMVQSDQSIKLLGYVDDPLPFIQRAAVFVVPILSGGGTRLKVLEAMSAGKAIVTTSTGCEGIEGINGEHFIVADTPGSFADAVIKVIHEKRLREILGHNARMLAETKYDWNIIQEKLNEFYMEAING